jgi:hypothetical protein
LLAEDVGERSWDVEAATRREPERHDQFRRRWIDAGPLTDCQAGAEHVLSGGTDT